MDKISLNIDQAEEIAEMISCTRNLRELSIQKDAIDKDVLSIVLEPMLKSSMTNIDTLNLAENMLNVECAELIFKNLKGMKSLRKLNISQNYLGREGALWIA